LYIRATAPWLVLGGYDVKPAQDLGLVVGGFEPDGRVRLSLETRAEPAAGSAGTPTPPHEPVALGELPTDAVGNTAWSTVRMPVVPAGAYTLVVRGDPGGQELRRDVTVKPFAPVLELSPWAGPPGGRISVNARGFAPGESVDVVLGEDDRAATALPADGDGNIWGGSGGRVPYEAAPGSLSVTLRGQQSGARATAQFKVVEPRPWLELAPWWGPAGVPVGFHGGGWAAGERITFHVDSAMTPAVVEGQADDGGWLRGAGPATVPPDATRKVTFVAVGEQSHAVATATFTVSAPSAEGRGLRIAAGPARAPSGLARRTQCPIATGRDSHDARDQVVAVACELTARRGGAGWQWPRARRWWPPSPSERVLRHPAPRLMG